MDKKDKEYIDSSIDSGNKYGYPKCCIDEFISKTPSMMKNSKPSENELLRLKMAHIGDKFTGFIPCIYHAKLIASENIKLTDIVNHKKRKVLLPFPHDWSLR